MPRAQITTLARGWLGTPYHHQASLKGVGTDCIGLVRGIYRELYGGEAEAIPAYSRDWAEATGEETLIARLLDHTGFASHSAARGLGQGAYLPLERVLADPPRLVLAAGDERMLRHPALRRLEGARYGWLDPSLLYCGGPTIVTRRSTCSNASFVARSRVGSPCHSTCEPRYSKRIGVPVGSRVVSRTMASRSNGARSTST